MRKTIALFLAVAFTAMIAGAVYARTLEEERDAVRDYLKVLDAKIIKHRKAGNTAVVKKLQGDKAATLRRWEKVKAELAAPLPPSPPPSPTVVAPAPAPVAAGALFGLGVNSLLKLDYGNYGKGMLGTIVLRGDVVLDDFVGLGPMVGLSSKSVKYAAGLGGLYGRDANDNLWRAIPIYVGGIIDIPADVLGGIESYLSGGLNYPISGSKTGVIGGGIAYGIKGDLGLGLGGKTSVELGWSIVRATNPTRSSKGLTISVGQDLAL